MRRRNVLSKHFSSFLFGGGYPTNSPLNQKETFGWVENIHVAASHFCSENGLHFCRAAKEKKKTLSKTKTLIFSPPLVKSFAIRIARSLFCHSALGAKKVPFSLIKTQPIRKSRKRPAHVCDSKYVRVWK